MIITPQDKSLPILITYTFKHEGLYFVLYTFFNATKHFHYACKCLTPF